MKKKMSKNVVDDVAASSLFLAGLFGGLGIGGGIYGDYASGAFIGLAIGFLAAAILKLARAKRSK